jgi:hypothetical protein
MRSISSESQPGVSDLCRRCLAYLPPLLVGGIALWLYASTAAPWLTWAHHGADGGDLIAASWTLGVPHPTGYPTYCLLGRAFALLPLGSIARRYALFSATLAAVTVALSQTSIRRLLREGRPCDVRLEAVLSSAAALALATSPILWSQAIIAEVYALGAALVALCLMLALRLAHPARLWLWAVLGLCMGLGLGAHLTVVLLLPGLAILLWPQLTPRRAGALALGGLAGIAIYAYLPLAARAQPPVNWGNPTTLESFWWMVSGQLYHDYALSLPLEYLPARLAAWLRLSGQQFTWPGLALALVGLWSWIERKRYRLVGGAAAILAAFAIYSILYNTTDSYVYLIPSFMVLALWLAEGVRALLDSLAPRSARHAAPLRMLCACALLLIPAWSLWHNYATLDLSDDQSVARWVDETLTDLPENAILITGQDRHTFTLDYVRWVEGRRTDLIVIDGELLAQPWYVAQLRQRHPSLQSWRDPWSLEQLIRANQGSHAVFLASPREELAHLFELLPKGELLQVAPKVHEGVENAVRLSP